MNRYQFQRTNTDLWYSSSIRGQDGRIQNATFFHQTGLTLFDTAPLLSLRMTLGRYAIVALQCNANAEHYSFIELMNLSCMRLTLTLLIAVLKRSPNCLRR